MTATQLPSGAENADGHGRERPGFVSVFTGRFLDEDALEEHVCFDYNNDDDDADEVSRFTIESGIGFYDEDFAECGYWDEQPLATALLEHSHGQTIDSQAAQDLSFRPQDNSLYSIYDFDATGVDEGMLRLLGVYGYAKGHEGGA